MSKPRLLDLFCGAGGASMGYHQAGFDVVGVDINPQPHYPFEFHQADALTFPLDGFDAIHASPPCQFASRLSHATGRIKDHPNLIPATRARLLAAGVPYAIENVDYAWRELINPVLMCGPALGLEVLRHRLFESNRAITGTGCRHVHGGTTTGLYVAFRQSCCVARGRKVPPRRSETEFKHAMAVGWMTNKEARQAIPPAYTLHLGLQLL